MSFAAPNTYKRFTREEDRLIYRRRKHGAHWRGIAKELGRTYDAVRRRYAILEEWIEEAHGDVLERHREEELRLLDKILGGAE